MTNKISLGSNIQSLTAQRSLSDASAQLSRSFERLSSGQRINRAADDVAGLAVASASKVRSKIFTQAVRNVNDGISLVNVANGALNAMSGIVTRQIELAQQAANGSYSVTQRQALDQEAWALTQEYNRIAASTEFNGIKPFSNGGQTVQVMAGIGSSALLAIGAGQQIKREVGTGEFTEISVAAWGEDVSNKADAADINNDGIADVVTKYTTNYYQIYFGQTDGSYAASGLTYGTGSSNASIARLADFTGDGNTDLVYWCSGYLYLKTGNGTTITTSGSSLNPTRSSDIRIADLNNDGKSEIVTFDSGGYEVYVANSAGVLSRTASVAIANLADLQLADVNADGFQDFAAQLTTSNLAIYYGKGDGTFETSAAISGIVPGSTLQSISMADYNHDGYADLLAQKLDNSFSLYTNLRNGLTGASDPGMRSSGTNQIQNVMDLNSDGQLDVVETSSATGGLLLLYRNNGDASFTQAPSPSHTYGIARTVRTEYLNRDSVADLIIADTTGTYALTQKTTFVVTAKRLDLTSVSGARQALDDLRTQQENIGSELGSLGACQGRMECAVSTLGKMADELLASASRITDVDVAEESSGLARIQILQQSASAVLAQANQSPQIALRLLQG